MSEEVRVYIDSTQDEWFDVEINSSTSCAEIIQAYLTDTSEALSNADYYMVELCMGYERAMDNKESISEALQKWSNQRDRVQFILKSKDNLRKSKSSETDFDSMSAEQLKAVSGKQLLQLAQLQRKLQQQRQQLLNVKQLQLQTVTEKSISKEQFEQVKKRLEEKEKKLAALRRLKQEALKQANHNASMYLELQSTKDLFCRTEQKLSIMSSELDELTARVKNKKQNCAKADKPEYSNEQKILLVSIEKENRVNRDQLAQVKRQKDSLLVHISEQRALDRKIADLTNTLESKRKDISNKQINNNSCKEETSESTSLSLTSNTDWRSQFKESSKETRKDSKVPKTSQSTPSALSSNTDLRSQTQSNSQAHSKIPVWSKNDARYQSFPADKKFSTGSEKSSNDGRNRRVASFDEDESSRFNEDGLKKMSKIGSADKSSQQNYSVLKESVADEIEPDMSVVSGRSSDNLFHPVPSALSARSKSSEALDRNVIVQESNISESKPGSSLLSVVSKRLAVNNDLSKLESEDVGSRRFAVNKEMEVKIESKNAESERTTSKQYDTSKENIAITHDDSNTENISKSALSSNVAASILSKGPLVKVLEAQIMQKPSQFKKSSTYQDANDRIGPGKNEKETERPYVLPKSNLGQCEETEIKDDQFSLESLKTFAPVSDPVGTSTTSLASTRTEPGVHNLATKYVQIMATRENSGVGAKMMSHFAPRPYGSQFGANLKSSEKSAMKSSGTTSAMTSVSRPIVSQKPSSYIKSLNKNPADGSSASKFSAGPVSENYRQKFGASQEYREHLRNMYQKEFDPSDLGKMPTSGLQEDMSPEKTMEISASSSMESALVSASSASTDISTTDVSLTKSEPITTITSAASSINTNDLVTSVEQSAAAPFTSHGLSSPQSSPVSSPLSSPRRTDITGSAGYYRVMSGEDSADFDVERLRYISIVPRPVRRKSSTSGIVESNDLSIKLDSDKSSKISADVVRSVTGMTSFSDQDNIKDGQIVSSSTDGRRVEEKELESRSESSQQLSEEFMTSTENTTAVVGGTGIGGGRRKKTVMKLSRRVSFEPLALLLDAALEGELEVVKSTAASVRDINAANEEGVTALHNAICAGHFAIVKFLVDSGCDVNAADSDGWTPLHCAASCNSHEMLEYLLEHGACIFATTVSDQELAVDKCEEYEEGYQKCLQYLRAVESDCGIINDGVIYAAFDYTADNDDELSFLTGDKLTVLRKGDEEETDWWWCNIEGREGFVPRNLISLYPRVAPQWLKSSDVSSPN